MAHVKERKMARPKNQKKLSKDAFVKKKKQASRPDRQPARQRRVVVGTTIANLLILPYTTVKPFDEARD